MYISDKTKYVLTKIGSRSSGRAIHVFNAVANYLEVGRWMHARGFEIPRRVDRRERIFDGIAAQIAESRALYLEFGVHRGASMIYWSKLLRCPESRLHGFDSFEGLPEKWNSTPTGFFSTGGAIPVVDDPRVTFFKGWFEDVLPRYSLPDHNHLVVNLDADLYSSTAYVLNFLKSSMRVGTFVYFDEFSDRHHELKAFDEFLSATEMQFRVFGANETLTHVAFQRTA
jgi:Macrocin-O-methyltransferase (TylF)